MLLLGVIGAGLLHVDLEEDLDGDLLDDETPLASLSLIDSEDRIK